MRSPAAGAGKVTPQMQLWETPHARRRTQMSHLQAHLLLLREFGLWTILWLEHTPQPFPTRDGLFEHQHRQTRAPVPACGHQPLSTL